MTTFRKLCRENTGTHFLDSGGAYGRHWQRPLIPEDSPIIVMDTYTDRDGNIHPEPYIETGAWLSALLDIRTDLSDGLRDYAEGRKDAWKDITDDYMDATGYEKCSRWDNSYNWETHLTQVFQICAYVPRGSSTDWVYNPDTILALQIHTGADVRGGYAAPVLCEGSGNFPSDALYALLDPVIGIVPIAGFRPDAEYKAGQGHYIPLDWEELNSLTERFRIGYTSNPLYEFETEVKRIFGFTLDREANTVVCQLDTGEVIKVAFVHSAEY